MNPIDTFCINSTLSILNYILEVGTDEVLQHIADNVSLEDVTCFPYVYNAIKTKPFNETIPKGNYSNE